MRASTIAYSNGEWTGAGDDSAGLVLWVGAPKVAADPAANTASAAEVPAAIPRHPPIARPADALGHYAPGRVTRKDLLRAADRLGRSGL